MCGIAGAFSFDKNSIIEQQFVEKMITIMHHRGPDGEWSEMNELGGLGACRLSFIDIPGGKQPISNEDNTIILVCNGEIYNYKTLRKQLIKNGHIFKTQCDIEVIIHLFEEEGIAFINKLKGQFAFVLFDISLREVFLVRDQFGICPLFYTLKRNNLIFASELKAILQFPDVERRISLTALDQVFSLPGLVSPMTMFENIKSIPPGHYLYAKQGDIKVVVNEYWDFILPNEEDDYEINNIEEAKEILEEILHKSVNFCINHSDNTVGILLSGGLDSSIITALAEKSSSNDKEIFSIIIGLDDYNESKYQEKVMEQVGLVHNKLKFSPEEIVDTIKEVVWYSECPMKETINSALYKLSHLVQNKNIKTVINGSGADELFAGYLGYIADTIVSRSRNRSEEEKLICNRLWGTDKLLYEIEFSEHKVLKSSLFSENIRNNYSDFDFTYKNIINKERIQGLNSINRRSYIDLKLRLPERILLDQYDHMFTARGIEGRYPFLSIDMVDFCRKLNPNLKLKGLNQKHVLREVGKKYLSKEITERKKFVFSAPGSTYLLKNNFEWISDTLSKERIKRNGFFDADMVEKVLKQYRNSDINTHPNYGVDILYLLLTFNIFMDLYNISSI